MKNFGKVGMKYTKQDESDVVTAADLEANEYLVDKIKKEYPDHGVISEESDEFNSDAEYVWTVDPLDGTLNFATGVPLFGTMISLIHNRQVTNACIFDPVHDELSYAEKGKGAQMNNQRIYCSDRKVFEHSYGTLSARMSENGFLLRKIFVDKSKEAVFNINQIGSIAISSMHIAEGKRDWKISRGAFVWDYAPAALIMKESGCMVTNFQGKEWTIYDREMLAANPTLHKQLLEIINS